VGRICGDGGSRGGRRCARAGKPIRRHPDAYTARTVIGSAAQRRQTVVAATVVFPDQRRAAYDPRWERRLRAGLLLDAMMAAEAVQAGLGQPIMWITRDADTMRLDRRRARAVLHPAQSAHPTSSNQTRPHSAATVVGA
jgi:hypothetical protein